MKLSLLISVLLFSFTAAADEWGTPDKGAHKITSGVAALAAYPVLRYNGFEHPAEWAFGLVVIGGVFKEVALDPRGIGNGIPSRPSGKDAAANAIGAGVSYLLLKGGELIEDEYGVNPFYWRF